MCGVVGYVGSKDAVAVLLDGLRRLEYRGYDSAGVAVLNGRGVETRKLAGRIAALRDLVAREPVHGTCGIGHTRWATHGAPTEQNAHPHTDCTGTLALVHNGIVENADLLRLQLERAGHRFATETDTETLAHLIEAAAGETLEGYRVLDGDARPQVRTVDEIEWDLETLALGGYPHFMLKEICEQPETVRSTLRGRLLPVAGTARLNGLNVAAAQCAYIRRIVIVACGTSWHAGLVGRHVIEELSGIPVGVEYASECRYGRKLRVPGTLTIAISQSGETADTVEALRAAKAAGSRVVGIVNVVGSTIAREADGGIYLHAGPEVGVASTKAFTSQLVALLLLGLHLGRQRGLSVEDGRELAAQLAQLPELVARTLELEPEVQALAQRYADANNALYLGRGVNFPVALEGALKLKEISYIHAEGYPAAEMKHGPIALIDENMPVVFLAPKDQVYAKALSNMQEVKARGGHIIAITSEGNGDLCHLADHELRVPACPPLLSPVLTVIPLQLLAYHIAVLRGCDVDRPRNLAKSVTVE